MHLSLNGVVSADNEFEAAIFRIGNQQPVAVVSRPTIADQRIMLDETMTVVPSSAAARLNEVRVGLPRRGGTLFLNGDAKGPDPTLPVRFLEITEAN